MMSSVLEMNKQSLLKNIKDNQNAYGAFLEENGTKVELDEEAGLLESSYEKENRRSQSSGPKELTTFRTKFKRKKLSHNEDLSGKQNESSQESGKEGSYYLWGHKRSDSESSNNSDSSDELFNRGSSSSRTSSSHSCHDRPMKGGINIANRTLWKLSIASFMSLSFMVIEFIGGYYASSLAVFSDAGHFLGDFAGFVIILFVFSISKKSPNAVMNFGYFRAEILGSLACILIMWMVTGLLVYEAIQRIVSKDYDINGDVMVVISGIGVFVHATIAVILHGCRCLGSKSSETDSFIFTNNFTLRYTFIHVVGKMLMSAALLTAALVIKFYPDYKIGDPVLTFVFGLAVMLITIPILRDVTHILMEGCPNNVSFSRLLDDLESLPGVKMVHDLHLWTLSIDKNALAVHIAIDPSFTSENVLAEAQKLVREKYFVFYSTIQVEPFHKSMETCHECATPPGIEHSSSSFKG